MNTIGSMSVEQPNLFSNSDDETAKSLLSNLLNQSRLYHQSTDYRALLDFVARLRNFAPFNAFLLHLQKPGLRFAASAYDWANRFDRVVKEGARPLLILWPFSPVALVYDMEDTEGELLPDSVQQAFRASGDLKKAHIFQFTSLLIKQGIGLKLIAYGDAHAGHIQAEHKPEGLEIGERSTDVKVRPTYHISVNSTHEPNVQFVTLVHELAHLYLGHLGPDKYLKIAERTHPKHELAELEAESVAYLVCARNGVSSLSEEYLANFVRDNETIESFDLYLLLKAAGQIENALQIGDMVSFGLRKT